jgi:TetR/AcrR family transcriptional repressor of bet genes
MNEYSFILWHYHCPMATAAVTKSRRTASREARRAQLIDATMKCIARKGMGSTTLGDVAREAGLSQGIVNLHFKSKENLLKHTLRALADEYREQFDKTLQRSPPRPADRLWALLEMDIKPPICDRRKLAVWFSFWGEVKSRPTYRRMCDEWDRHYETVIEEICRELIEEAGYAEIDAATVATALTSMTNGMWLSCLISPGSWKQQQCLAAIRSYLASIFPQHYKGQPS